MYFLIMYILKFFVAPSIPMIRVISRALLVTIRLVLSFPVFLTAIFHSHYNPLIPQRTILSTFPDTVFCLKWLKPVVAGDLPSPQKQIIGLILTHGLFALHEMTRNIEVDGASRSLNLVPPE